MTQKILKNKCIQCGQVSATLYCEKCLPSYTRAFAPTILKDKSEDRNNITRKTVGQKNYD